MVLIFLDAGHGGRDGGAIHNTLREKDLTLDICKRIGNGLKHYHNVHVMYSRTDDEYVSLLERARKANQADAKILISVHINSSTKAQAKGFESYVYPNASSATVALQNVMHEEIMKALGKEIENRGKKQRNLAILRNTKMKAILTENLFISNHHEAKLLEQAQFRQKIADGHIIGLVKFLGLKKSAQPPPIEPEKIWTVQVGAFCDKNQADAFSKDLLKLGYIPIVKET